MNTQEQKRVVRCLRLWVKTAVFCLKYVWTVVLDNTVSLGELCLQLLPDKERLSYA